MAAVDMSRVSNPLMSLLFKNVAFKPVIAQFLRLVLATGLEKSIDE